METYQSSYFNNPLFSGIVTFFILILLYLPQFFLKIIFSPLLISTLILLLSLLRLGASQQQQEQQRWRQRSSISHGGGANAPPQSMTHYDLDPIENQALIEHGPEVKPEPEPEPVIEPRQEGKGEGDVTRPPCNTTEAEPEPEPEPSMVVIQPRQGDVTRSCNTTEAHATVEPGPGPEPEPEDDSVDGRVKIQNLGWAEPEPVSGPKRLVEWDVGAPLEVIYEAYDEGEEEEEGEEAKNDVFWKKNEVCYNMKGGVVLDRYPSLSRYYPDTDSDSDSDLDSEISSSMSWDEEYKDKEGLIEISLDYNNDNKKASNVMSKVVEKEWFCIDDDEENLIEIDIFPIKNMGDFAC